ncbi:MAG: hypothetical protein ACREKE_06155, partial [bacterium]
MTDAHNESFDKSQSMDLELLRGLALGGKRSQELEFLVASQSTGHTDYQALTLAIADLSIPEERARATFERLS